MKNLNNAMKDMKITKSFEYLYSFMQISQSCGFGGLGEDQNISLATERWKINGEWKTPSAVRHIAKLFTTIETFLESDQRCIPLLHHNCGEYSDQKFRNCEGYND